MFALSINEEKILLDEGDLSLTPDESTIRWYHFDGEMSEAREWLFSLKGPDLDSINVLSDDFTRPRLFITENDELILTLRGIGFGEQQGMELISLRAWMTSNVLITVSRYPIPAIEAAQKKLCKKAKGISLPHHILWLVCEQLVTDITNDIDTKDETVDSLENTWESDHTLDIDTLTLVRLDMSKLRRFLLPQLEAFQKLSLVILEQFSTEKENAVCAARWREICNSTHRDLEVITEMKERVTILKEGLEQRMNRAMNRIMYLLSVVAAFFLPLTFIASLLGMNVKGIPGNEHPWAFFSVCGVMLIVSLFQLLLFKRWKWFG